MAIDSEFRKLLNGEAWAENGNRIDLESSVVQPPIDRGIGWPSSFSTTDTPARTRMNQMFRELYGAAKEVGMGVSPYDAGVNYPVNAIVQHSSKLWRANSAHNASSPVSPAPSGQSVWQEIASTNVQAPSAPAVIPNSDIYISYTDARNFRVYWDAPDDGGLDITQYDMRYSKQSNFTGGTTYTISDYQQGDVVSSGISANDADLYYVQVRARNSQFTRAFSSSTPGKQVSSSALSPEAINFIQASPSSGSVTLSWALPFMRGLTLSKYVVEWRSGNQSFSTSASPARHIDITNGATSRTITGLTNGTSYTFRVTAVSNRNTSTVGTYTVSSTPTTGQTASAPSNVINLNMIQGRAEGSLIAYTNSAPSDNGSKITAYTWEMRIANTGSWADPPGSNSATTEVPFIILSGLSSNEWEIRVKARNSIGLSASWSNAPKETPYYPTNPGQPSVEGYAIPDATTAGKVLFAISSIPSTGGSPITKVEWQRKLTSQSDSSWAAVSPSPPDTQTYLELTETAGTSVDVRARLRAGARTGSWSSTESIVPPSLIVASQGVPSKPSIVVANAVGSSAGPKVLVSFSADPEDNNSTITDFNWRWRTDNVASNAWQTYLVPASQRGSPYALIGDGLLLNNTEYDFSARAVNDEGNGDWSDPVSITPVISLTRYAPVQPILRDIGNRWAALEEDSNRSAFMLEVTPNSLDTGGPITGFEWELYRSSIPGAVKTRSIYNTVYSHDATDTFHIATPAILSCAGNVVVRSSTDNTFSFISVSSIAGDETYQIRVRLQNSQGWSAWSAWRTNFTITAI